MKYKGKKLEGVNTDVLVLQRGSDRIVLKAKALQNFDHFDELCPTPEPPVKILPGGIKESNPADPNYQKLINELSAKKTNYTVIKSLEATEELEWESVDLGKPGTWENWRKELEDSGFTEIEIIRIFQLCTKVNCLDDSALEFAKESFLAEARLEEK
jgi:hypothetical protein